MKWFAAVTATVLGGLAPELLGLDDWPFVGKFALSVAVAVAVALLVLGGTTYVKGRAKRGQR